MTNDENVMKCRVEVGGGGEDNRKRRNEIGKFTERKKTGILIECKIKKKKQNMFKEKGS